MQEPHLLALLQGLSELTLMHVDSHQTNAILLAAQALPRLRSLTLLGHEYAYEHLDLLSLRKADEARRRHGGGGGGRDADAAGGGTGSRSAGAGGGYGYGYGDEYGPYEADGGGGGGGAGMQVAASPPPGGHNGTASEYAYGGYSAYLGGRGGGGGGGQQQGVYMNGMRILSDLPPSASCAGTGTTADGCSTSAAAASASASSSTPAAQLRYCSLDYFELRLTDESFLDSLDRALRGGHLSCPVLTTLKLDVCMDPVIFDWTKACAVVGALARCSLRKLVIGGWGVARAEGRVFGEVRAAGAAGAAEGLAAGTRPVHAGDGIEVEFEFCYL